MDKHLEISRRGGEVTSQKLQDEDFRERFSRKVREGMERAAARRQPERKDTAA